MGALPEIGTVFEYIDTDHVGGGVSGRYRVTGLGTPNRRGDRFVMVEAVEVENWPGTSAILHWEEQVEAGLIVHISDCTRG